MRARLAAEESSRRVLCKPCLARRAGVSCPFRLARDCLGWADLDFFSHVTRDHPFQDSGLFYRFTEDAKMGGVATDGSGKKVSLCVRTRGVSYRHRMYDNSSKHMSVESKRQDKIFSFFAIRQAHAYTSDHFLLCADKDSWTALATRLFPTTSGGEPLTQADLEGVVSRDADMIGTLVDIGVSPIDEYNTQLLDNVHPANWRDAEPDGVRGSSNDAPDFVNSVYLDSFSSL